MIDPALLGYLMGPLALVAILLLMHFGYITHESAWVWLAVFIAVPTCNLVVDRIYDRRPDTVSLNIRVAAQVAAVSAVIYLTGWGPVLWGAYAFIALEVIAKCGSRSWLSVVVWTLVGMAVGQLAIWIGLAPDDAPGRPGHGGHRHGGVRPGLRRAHGRRHHGAEGGRRRAPSD